MNVARRTVAVATTALLWASGCASASSAAAGYRDAGRHELATLYFALHLKSAEGDPEARRDLVRSVENASRSLDAEYEQRMQAGASVAALGTALRKADLLSYASALELGETAALTAAPEVKDAHERARRDAIARLDEAEGSNRPENEMLELLRVARAFSPNDPELAARYERKRASMSRTVITKTSCAPGHQAWCSALAGEVLARVTRERRELTAFATPDSETKDTQLTLELTTTSSDTGWRRIERDKAKSKVQRLDRFKEPIVNHEGKPTYEEVKAAFEVFERIARGTVTARAEVTDLGPSNATLFSRDVSVEKKDVRRYIEWTGDERALSPEQRAHGTDRSPPAPTDALLQRAVDEVASQLAKELLAQLEGGKS